jgi:hypothetical protein
LMVPCRRLEQSYQAVSIGRGWICAKYVLEWIDVISFLVNLMYK